MKLLITCREARERVTEYQEGALSWRERAAVWLHLLICSACDAFFHGLRALPGVARFLAGPEEPPPAEAEEALRRVLRKLDTPAP